MKMGQLKYSYCGWPLLLLSLFSAGCTEIFFFRTWRQPPPSSYIEPGPPKTAEEVRNPFYSIDSVKGVTCFSPDEEKTSQKDGLLIKECLWKNVPYKNGQPGLLWLTFSKKGDGCWQLHQEQNEGPSYPSEKSR